MSDETITERTKAQREACKRYYRKHKEELKAYARQYYLKKKERSLKEMTNYNYTLLYGLVSDLIGAYGMDGAVEHIKWVESEVMKQKNAPKVAIESLKRIKRIIRIRKQEDEERDSQNNT